MTGLNETTAKMSPETDMTLGFTLSVLTNVANFVFIGLVALSFELFKLLNSDLHITQS